MNGVGLKRLVLLAGDIGTFAAALFVSIVLRYPNRWNDPELLQQHFWPFSLVFAIWATTLFVFNLYDLRRLSNRTEFFSLAGQAFTINAALAIAFFYIVRSTGIAPRAVLAADIAFTVAFFGTWRLIFNRSITRTLATPIVLVGVSAAMERLQRDLASTPSLGYRVAGFAADNTPKLQEKPMVPVVSLADMPSFVARNGIRIAVLEKLHGEAPERTLAYYALLPLRLSFFALPSFTEHVFQRVTLKDVSEAWFLEHLSEGEKRTFEVVKRACDIAGSIAVGLITLPFMLAVALGIKLEDGRRVLYRQTRVGKDGKIFSLVKFQSMVENAETSGPRWTTAQDARITRFGAFIRKTRLDELPQLWNVIKGDLSFVGPRPERPEFVERLGKEIPFYGLRHIVRPGLTGWAQINKPRHTVEDSYEKLEYDLYYVKNRSLALDTAIALKTLSIIMRREGH